jgi:hypothetical protein
LGGASSSMVSISQYAILYLSISFMLFLLMQSSYGGSCGVWSSTTDSGNSTSLISLVKSGASGGAINRPLTDYLTNPQNIVAGAAGVVAAAFLVLSGAPILLVAAAAIISPFAVQFVTFTSLLSGCDIPAWLYTILAFIDVVNVIMLAAFLAYFYSWRQV